MSALPSVQRRNFNANGIVDNNASYPSPTQLTTNASYNAMAEMEYSTFKTGGLIAAVLFIYQLTICRAMDSRFSKCPRIQSFTIDQ